MKRKILFLIMLLTFVMSCGSRKNSDSSGNDLKDVGKFNYYMFVLINESNWENMENYNGINL